MTYSPSITIVLTYDCPWHCSYCGFRKNRDGLADDGDIAKKLSLAKRWGAREILLISGENPDSLPHLREELSRRGFARFIDFASNVANQCLLAGMLPHGNYGALSRDDLRTLKKTHASMGVMLENIFDDPKIAPEKKSEGRLATIRAAGEARIAFTSGILVGCGENEQSRFDSLDALAECHHRHGHLQEILIQNYVPNQESRLKLSVVQPGINDYRRLIDYWKKRCPDVPVQIPPNLNPHWLELAESFDDIGGISPEEDVVNPGSPWSRVEDYRAALADKSLPLKPRLAVYERFIGDEFLSSRVLAAAGAMGHRQ